MALYAILLAVTRYAAGQIPFGEFAVMRAAWRAVGPALGVVLHALGTLGTLCRNRQFGVAIYTETLQTMATLAPGPILEIGRAHV